MNNLWLNSCGFKEDWSWLEPIKDVPTYEELFESEWDEGFYLLVLGKYESYIFEEFKALARNRMVMGAMRYGTLASENYKDYDHVSNYRGRLKLAFKTRNLEGLIDAYNIAYLHYRSTGDKVTAKIMASQAMDDWFWYHTNKEWSMIASDDQEHCTKKEEHGIL